MHPVLRKLRGAILIGATWFVGWAAFGFLIGSLIWLVDPASIDGGEEPWRMGLIIGAAGFLCGTIFSAIFAFAERSKVVRNLSVMRAALWGLIGGIALPLMTSMNDQVILNTAPLAAFSAAAMVALARRGLAAERSRGEHRATADHG